MEKKEEKKEEKRRAKLTDLVVRKDPKGGASDIVITKPTDSSSPK